MFVRNRMSQKVVTVAPQDSLEDARALLHRHHIRQLPVMRNQRLVGIITDRDLRGGGPQAKTVAELMTPKPKVVGPNVSVDEAARLLTTYKIGALPVLQGNRLVGIIASADILNAFVELSGVREPSYRIVIAGAKGKQAAAEVRQIVAAGRGELKWLHPDSRDAAKLHLRVKARRVDDIVTKLEAAGFDVSALVAPSPARQS
ncbi:MAG: CBS domain-containing protein [Candidatus Binatia bacterium]